MSARPFTKLKDGSWGVRMSGSAPAPGAMLTVATKAGPGRVVIIRGVAWSGKDRSGKPSACSPFDQADLAEQLPTTHTAAAHMSTTNAASVREPGTQCWETGMAH